VPIALWSVGHLFKITWRYPSSHSSIPATLYFMCYSTCFASKPYYHCRKCGLCSIFVAQMSWVINNSNTIQSITLYFSCTPKVAWLPYLMPSISLYCYRFKIRFETPILRGNDKNATAREKHVGSNVAKVITYFLNFFLFLMYQYMDGVWLCLPW